MFDDVCHILFFRKKSVGGLDRETVNFYGSLDYKVRKPIDNEGKRNVPSEAGERE